MEDNKLIRWQKVGGAAMYLRNRIIKPGQIFTATIDEIPRAFRDICIPLDEIKKEEPTPIEVAKHEYTIIPRGKSKTFFDVVDSNGKAINEKALHKSDAEQLIKDIEK